MCTCFLNDAKSPTAMYGFALWWSHIVYTSISPYCLNPTTAFYFVTERPDVTVLVWGCVQATNSPGFSQCWTTFPNMWFSRPTLDVVLYHVLRLSQQLCWESVCNVMLYEVLQVSEKYRYSYGPTTNAIQNVLCLLLSICVVQMVRACALWTSCLVQRVKYENKYNWILF